MDTSTPTELRGAIDRVEELTRTAHSLDGDAHREVRLLCARLMDAPTLVSFAAHVARIEALLDVLFTAHRHEALGGADQVRAQVLLECARLRESDVLARAPNSRPSSRFA